MELRPKFFEKKVACLLVFLSCACIIKSSISFAQDTPDLSHLGYDAQRSIELACFMAKTRGPAYYGKCIIQMLSEISEKPIY